MELEVVKEALGLIKDTRQEFDLTIEHESILVGCVTPLCDWIDWMHLFNTYVDTLEDAISGFLSSQSDVDKENLANAMDTFKANFKKLHDNMTWSKYIRKAFPSLRDG